MNSDDESPAERNQRLATCRAYFERGCHCVVTGRLTKVPPSVDDESAVATYEASCVCSRNYVTDQHA